MFEFNKKPLEQRKEFYIHYITRNGKKFDDVEKEINNPIIKQTKSSDIELPVIKSRSFSYAESVGYREDPKRYNNLRTKKEDEEVFNNVNEMVEDPIMDETIGYYDQGVIYDEEPNDITYDTRPASYDDLYPSIDEVEYDSRTTKEKVTTSFVRESLNTKPTSNYSDKMAESYKQFQAAKNPHNTQPYKPEPYQSYQRRDEYVATRPVKTYHEPVKPVERYTEPEYTNSKPIVKEEKPIQSKKRKTRYVAPPIDLLTRSGSSNSDNKEEAERQKEIINNTFIESGIRASVEKYIFGPTVTQFLVSIEKGANVKDIRKVESNLLMYLQCETIRIQTPIPGKPYAGIEVPKKIENRKTVFLGDMLASKDFKNLNYEVPVAVGEDNYSVYHYIDLVEMPHGLIAGTTKSGKSVCLNTFLLSLIYRFTPDELRLVLIDPKRIELGMYEGIPHLAMPVIVDQEDFQSALGWVFDEMERRYKEFELYDEHNITDYNDIRKKEGQPVMPHIVVIMDEFSDWFSDANNEVELYMQKLAAKARAAGINIILATQRPSKDVIKGTIKANFDTRIAFRVSSFEDAKVIMGYGGAEKLEGKGDMLIRYAGRAEQRLQGAFVPNSDIKAVNRFLKENNTCEYLVTKEEIHQSTVARSTSSSNQSRAMGINDERFEEVAFYVVRNKNASVNKITQIFGMGFNRVNDIFLALEEMGVLSPGIKGKQREVLLDEFQLRDLLEENDN